MLDCVPRGLFSWTFDIHGCDAGPATATFDFFAEHGTLTLGATNLEVRKQGLFSGTWRLLQNGDVVAEASKVALGRRFDIRGDGFTVVLQPASFIGRSFDLFAGTTRIGRIEPTGAFGRTTTVRCDSRVPVAGQLFAFWLVALTWKRDASAD